MNDGTFIGLNGNRQVFTADNAKHIFVCGTTGSGKTVALGNYIKRAIDCDYPLLLVDGNGDVGEGYMLDIVQKLNPPHRKLYVVNLTNPQSSDTYNPFRETAPTIAKDMLVNLTKWNEEHYKLNAERYLQRLVWLLHKNKMSLSLKNIVRYMSANRFKELSAELLKNNVIDKDEHTDNLEIVDTSYTPNYRHFGEDWCLLIAKKPSVSYLQAVWGVLFSFSMKLTSTPQMPL